MPRAPPLKVPPGEGKAAVGLDPERMGEEVPLGKRREVWKTPEETLTQSIYITQ